MKKTFAMLATTVVIMLAGCASSVPMGAAFIQATLPLTATDAKCATLKIGTSTCKSYCGMVCIGDASIATAAQNGGITVIRNVDWKVESLLGIISTYTCTVYGE